MSDKGILLEAGTGEVELLEFEVANVGYVINVLKVKEILNFKDVTIVPKTDPAIMGITLIRGNVIPVIDLKYVLTGVKRTEYNTTLKMLLCEFNQLKVAFCIDVVHGIHRVGWSLIQRPDGIVFEDSPLVIGNVAMNEKILMLLDFEKIVTDIAPSTGINDSQIKELEDMDRSSIKLVLSDDSPMIRKLLLDVLTKAGFTNMKFFDDGQQAYEYLISVEKKFGENFTKAANIVITDLEMPQMDGHTLTRKIKEHPILKKLPVIIFSSLITEELRHKGESIGADAQMSKPEINQLVGIIDNFAKKIIMGN